MADTISCRSNSISGWEWMSRTFCIIVLSCCLLPLLSESAPIQAGYVWNGDPGFANITGPTAAKRVSTTYLASSPNEQYALALTIETSKTSTPTCYLEFFYFYSTSVETAPPPGSLISGSRPWTQPCPRKSLPNGNCTFAFTQDGDIQLLNTVAGRSNLVWNSNTTGLGATTLHVRDYDIVNYEYDGNLELRNSSGDIVWENGRNDTNYGCSDPSWGLAASLAAAAKRASVTNLICLALISFAGAALMLWDSGTARPGRDQLLIVGFVACCLLLPSSSESKPIQAGFTTNLWQNYTVKGYTGLIAMTDVLVESPTNRTALLFHVEATGSSGATCYLSVGADSQSTDIVLNASAPGPATPSTNLNTVDYVPWSAPCPRKLLPAIVNCTFTFTTSGDIQVRRVNVGAGTSEILWSSNTAGLGVTSLDMLDSDPSGSGSMVLYNNRSEVVWRNILNATDQNFQCLTPTSGAALRMSIASSSLALLVLSSTFLLKFPVNL
ncbi:hypothetical protein M758_2G219600 [Ceratodon purpureus]|nr:hypothetical protein M758_2G219600 [Ceratodon purpureus]